MLIRSQNRETIVNADATNHIFIVEVYRSNGTLYDVCAGKMRLGYYLTKTTAMKVLDMIQEAYADAKLNEILLPDVCKAANKSQQEKENTSIAKDIRNAFMKKMVFQMPDDESVEV